MEGSVAPSSLRAGTLNFGLVLRSPKSEAELRDAIGLRLGSAGPYD
jgi:hypothetical protein